MVKPDSEESREAKLRCLAKNSCEVGSLLGDFLVVKVFEEVIEAEVVPMVDSNPMVEVCLIHKSEPVNEVK